MTDEMFGPYRLERLVSRSGMGEVWQATDIVRGRSVALKRLPVGWADPELQARFRSELALAARLDEPHIIPIHDFGEIDGHLFVDMGLVGGTDLARLLAEHGPLTPARAVEVMTQVAAALDAAHAAGLVHRDIRPANLMVTTGTGNGGMGVPDAEAVYVSDFGIAGPLSGSRASSGAAGTTAGSLEYMAPEWLLHGHGDHRVDIYAQGCVLYEAMTARKPFPGDRSTATIQAHLNTAPPRAAQYRPDVPAALDQVIATAMAKEPARRYRSAGDLAAAARAALDVISVSPAAAPGMPSSPRRQVRGIIDPPTVPGLRLNLRPAPTAPPNRVTSSRTQGRHRSALIGVLVLLLAAGLGVVSLNQGRNGSTSVGTHSETTTVTGLPGPAPIAAIPRPTELRLIGHTGTVCAVTTADLNGRPVAVTGSWDKTVRVWDLATGAPVESPFTGHTDLVLGVATAEVNGHSVVVSIGKDNSVRVWDLATGAPIGHPLTDHTDTVFAVATAQLNGRPVVISATTLLDGRPVVLSAVRTIRCGSGTWPRKPTPERLGLVGPRCDLRPSIPDELTETVTRQQRVHFEQKVSNCT